MPCTTYPGTTEDNLGLIETGLREGRELTLSYEGNSLVVGEIGKAIDRRKLCRLIGREFKTAIRLAFSGNPAEWREQLVWRGNAVALRGIAMNIREGTLDM